MSQNYIDLGPGPELECLARTDQEGYVSRAHKECLAWMAQLKRHYFKRHSQNLPVSCGLYLRWHRGSEGRYRTVVIVFNSASTLAGNMAAEWLDSNLPENWDTEARMELGLQLEALSG